MKEICDSISFSQMDLDDVGEGLLIATCFCRTWLKEWQYLKSLTTQLTAFKSAEFASYCDSQGSDFNVLT